MVSAAAIRGEGQISVFDPVHGGPCYRCLYPEDGALTALSCSESGVLAPLVGVVGSLQAMESVKLLSGYGESLRGQLLMLDLRSMEIRKLALPRRLNCPDCSHLP
jgi:adenylyltransferase/sulfurtransferase